MHSWPASAVQACAAPTPVAPIEQSSSSQQPALPCPWACGLHTHMSSQPSRSVLFRMNMRPNSGARARRIRTGPWAARLRWRSARSGLAHGLRGRAGGAREGLQQGVVEPPRPAARPRQDAGLPAVHTKARPLRGLHQLAHAHHLNRQQRLIRTQVRAQPHASGRSICLQKEPACLTPAQSLRHYRFHNPQDCATCISSRIPLAPARPVAPWKQSPNWWENVALQTDVIYGVAHCRREMKTVQL